MPCHGKRGFLVKFQFALGFHSVFVKISWTFTVICFIKGFTMFTCRYCFVKVFTMFTCRFIYAKLCHRKRVLNVFHLRFYFFGLSYQTFLSFIKTTFKIYQKPQTIISFFPVYTKLCYIKRGLNDKLKHRLYKWWIILDVTFLEKKSLVTLANEVWQVGPGTSRLFHPILL